MRVVVAGLLGLAAVALAVVGWLAIGPSHVTVRNTSGHAVAHIWLALPERIADAGPLENGSRRTIWFWGSPRQGFLFFDVESAGPVVRGCAGEYLDTDFAHEWSIELQPAGAFVARDEGDTYPQQLGEKEAARGKAGWP